MIKKANLAHKTQIAELWNEAFGDNKADVLEYLEYLLKFFYVCEENGVVKAMAAVLSVSFQEKNGGYIYAVATRKNARGKGLSTELLNYIKGLQEYDFLVLVPQNEGLFEFYKNRGFVSFCSVTTKEISVFANKDAFCEEISTEEYCVLRKEYFGDSLIEWGSETLDFARKMYDGAFFKIKSDDESSACFCFCDAGKLVIKELLSENGEKSSEKIATFFGCKSVRVSYPDSFAKPFAMVYPDFFEKKYFAIALD